MGDGPVLRTPRLVLTPLRIADEPALHAHWNDPDVRRYLWDDRPVAAETVAEVVAASREHFASRGYGLFGLRPPDVAALMGVAGLRPITVDDAELGELLYSLVPAVWGRGLATEAARACLRLAFDRCGLARVVAGVDVPNVASRRVLERLGMRPLRDLRLPTGTFPYWQLARDQVDAATRALAVTGDGAD
jgi:RimJ/RimL family protein N-acetyltransferase